MIPYVYIDPLTIGSLEIPPFGILVGIAIFVGFALSSWICRTLGLDFRELASFLWAVLIGGLVGGHVFDAIFYYPREVMARPLLLLEIWNGFGSFGGFLGALLGALVWKYFERRGVVTIWKYQLVRPVRRSVPASIIPYADVVLSVFPISWCIGRMGCSIAHDHPGITAPAGSWFAVAFGPGPVHRFGFLEFRYGSVPRYDLGLLEMVFSALLAIAFALTWRYSRTAKGWYVVAACLAYAPVRFMLDFLRANDLVNGGDIRYAGLTPAQWACFALFAAGVAVAVHIYMHGRTVRNENGGEKEHERGAIG